MNGTGQRFDSLFDIRRRAGGRTIKGGIGGCRTTPHYTGRENGEAQRCLVKQMILLFETVMFTHHHANQRTKICQHTLRMR